MESADPEDAADYNNIPVGGYNSAAIPKGPPPGNAYAPQDTSDDPYSGAADPEDVADYGATGGSYNSVPGSGYSQAPPPSPPKYQNAPRENGYKAAPAISLEYADPEDEAADPEDYAAGYNPPRGYSESADPEDYSPPANTYKTQNYGAGGAVSGGYTNENSVYADTGTAYGNLDEAADPEFQPID